MRRAALVLAVATLLPVTADAEGLKGEVRIGSATEVKALCDELAPDADRVEREEARQAVYMMTLPAGSWSFLEYDAHQARLSVDAVRGFKGPKAAWELVLHELGAHSAKTAATGLAMAIPATAKEAVGLVKAQKAGQLALTLWFRPATPDGKGVVCAATHTRDGEGVRLAIEPMAFAITRGKDSVASGATEDFEALRDAEHATPSPTVTVAAPVLTNSPGDAPAEVARAARALVPGLTACYQEGLAKDPEIQGTIVVGVAVSANGAVTATHAEIDGLGAPAVTKCSLAVVQASKFPRAGEPFSFAVTFGAAD